MKSTVARHWVLPGVISILLAFLLAAPLAAERLVPFQGRLTDGVGAPLADGVYRVTFSIYDAPTSGTPLWVETHENVSIIGGQINVLLGSLTPLDDPDRNGITSDAVSFAGGGVNPVGARFLGIKIGEDTNQEMVPRHQLVPSFHAAVADRVVRGGVGTDQIADGAVTTTKLDPLAGLPVGAIVMWWGDVADIPEGFELCDGTLISTPGALISGNKPDMRNRMPVGVGSLVAPALGSYGGEVAQTVSATTLDASQMPSHAHTYTEQFSGVTPPGGHIHQIWGDNQPINIEYADPVNGVGGSGEAGIVIGRLSAANSVANLGLNLSIARSPSYITIDNTGGGASHTHYRGSFLGLHFILRVK